MCVCVSASVPREIPAKSASYVHLIQNQWCSEFVTYVLPCFKEQLTCNLDLVPVWVCLVPVLPFFYSFHCLSAGFHVFSAGFALFGAGFALLSAVFVLFGEREKD